MASEPARIPHAPPVRLVEQFTRDPDNQGASCSIVIHPDVPGISAGELGAGWAVEAAAQLAAALAASPEENNAGIRGGRLVAVNDWTIVAPISITAPLDVSIRLEQHFPPLLRYRARCEQDGVLCASGALTVQLTEELSS